MYKGRIPNILRIIWTIRKIGEKRDRRNANSQEGCEFWECFVERESGGI